MTTAHVVAELDWLVEYWPDLSAARLPGTGRPRPPSRITPERRAELDYEARIERLERTGVAPGEAPAPVDVAVLDALTQLLADAEELAYHAARAARAPILEPPSTGLADARPYLRYAAACLPTADGAWSNSRDLIHWATGLARGMADETQRALALIWDGQRVNAVCPWCKGGWFGDRTWWVRVLPGGIIAVVCESGLCTPPPGDVTTWYRGQPVWELNTWRWLAKRVAAAARREPPPPMPPRSYGLLSGRA